MNKALALIFGGLMATALLAGQTGAKKATPAAGPPLKQVAVWKLGAGDGRLGRLAIDLAGQRLFVIVPGAVEMVDMKTGRASTVISGLQSPQGIAYEPETGRLIVTTRDDTSAHFYESKNFGRLTSVRFSGGPGQVRLDAANKQVLVVYGNGAVALLTREGRLAGEIRLDSSPESFMVESKGTRVFVNQPLSHNVLVADRARRIVLRTWALETSSANYAMALDEAGRRLYVACRRPAKVVVLDTSNGLQVDERTTIKDPDEIHFDVERRRLYITGAEGLIDVVRQGKGDKFEPLAQIPTATGARTSLWSPELKRLFVAVPKSGAQPAEIRVFDALN